MPIFGLPVIGDIADAVVVGLLYHITKSKVSVVINAVEFIPFVGDFIPTYTISTLLWILNNSRRNQTRKPYGEKGHKPVKILKQRSAATKMHDQHDSIGTRIMRAYAIFRSRTL
jgi:hypothetical protein